MSEFMCVYHKKYHIFLSFIFLLFDCPTKRKAIFPYLKDLYDALDSF